MKLLWMLLVLFNLPLAQQFTGFTRLTADVVDTPGTKEFLSFVFKDSTTMSQGEFNKLLTKLKIEKRVKKELKGKKFKTEFDRDIYQRYVKEKVASKIDAKGCYNRSELLEIHKINETGKNITREDFLRMGPALLHELESGSCWTKDDDDNKKVPSKAETWGYGFLSIGIISFASLALIVIIPFIPKKAYARVMSYLVALAVGTMSGDALLHLIPHAFGEGANMAIGVIVDEEQEEAQEHSQIVRALFVCLGIYAFFGVELVMKLRGGGHGHSHGSHGHSNANNGHSHANGGAKPRAPSHTKAVTNEAVEVDIPGSETAEIKEGSNDVIVYQSQRKPSMRDAGEKQKEINRDTSVRTVAWVVIIGDGFHNFTDGLAVGAAFSASISSGLSTSIAIFCHELPHELGDFAVLLSSGMSWKQAIVYNLVSTTLAFAGLTAGILAGGEEEGRHFILSITAGLFLYVSLADLLPELTNEDIPGQSKIATFLVQNAGIMTGIGLMLVIALYEDKMGG